MAAHSAIGHRAIGKCSAGHVFSTTAHEAYENCWQVRCPACRRWTVLVPVSGTVGKRECGPWCTEGTGRRCTCQCGGKNHSSAISHTGALWQAS
jgi:hypothetical protein